MPQSSRPSLSPRLKSIDHNQYIYRGYTFQSNYEAGLRILWLDQETWTLTETGFFDVYPPSTTPSFRGTWSNYPYNLPMGESLISIVVVHLNLRCEIEFLFSTMN
jgi:hypothetical protein